jgi:hypothetical protein
VGLRRSETIHFEYNSFEGALPDIFSQLNHLKELHLNMNKFTGTLHTSLGMLTELSKKSKVLLLVLFVAKILFLKIGQISLVLTEICL